MSAPQSQRTDSRGARQAERMLRAQEAAATTVAASIADHGWFPQAPQRPAVGDGRRRELQFVVGGPAGASSGRKGLDHTCACPDLARYHSRQRSAVVSHNTNTSTRARRPPWGPATASRSLLSAVSCLLSAVCCRRACIRVLFSTPRHATPRQERAAAHLPRCPRCAPAASCRSRRGSALHQYC